MGASAPDAPSETAASAMATPRERFRRRPPGAGDEGGQGRDPSIVVPDQKAHPRARRVSAGYGNDRILSPRPITPRLRQGSNLRPSDQKSKQGASLTPAGLQRKRRLTSDLTLSAPRRLRLLLDVLLPKCVQCASDDPFGVAQPNQRRQGVCCDIEGWPSRTPVARGAPAPRQHPARRQQGSTRRGRPPDRKLVLQFAAVTSVMLNVARLVLDVIRH